MASLVNMCVFFQSLTASKRQAACRYRPTSLHQIQLELQSACWQKWLPSHSSTNFTKPEQQMTRDWVIFFPQYKAYAPLKVLRFCGASSVVATVLVIWPPPPTALCKAVPALT
jgi:hypothetical protein